MAQPVEEWYKQMPIITRSYLTAAVVTTIGCSLDGMVAGHAYYFLEDVYPWLTGRRPLKTVSFIKALFAGETVVVARPANVRFALVRASGKRTGKWTL